MNILFTHLGTPSECLIATSLLKGVVSSFQNSKVHVIVQDERCVDLFKFNERVRGVYNSNYLPEWLASTDFDVLLNLHPAFTKEDSDLFRIKEKRGFWFCPEHQFFQDVIYGGKKASISLFQAYYRLAGMKWRGQGYDLSYRPQTRSNKTKTGLAVANMNLKRYVVNHLKLDQTRLWTIPLRENVFKRLDELNRCGSIVTDDFFTMNLALFLRKKVHFLKTVPYPMKLEFFGRGQVYEVPNNIVL